MLPRYLERSPIRKDVITSTSTEMAVNHRATKQNHTTIYEHELSSTFSLCIKVGKSGIGSQNRDLEISFSHHYSRWSRLSDFRLCGCRISISEYNSLWATLSSPCTYIWPLVSVSRVRHAAHSIRIFSHVACTLRWLLGGAFLVDLIMCGVNVHAITGPSWCTRNTLLM